MEFVDPRTFLMVANLLGLLGYYGASILDFIGLQYISAGLERLVYDADLSRQDDEEARFRRKGADGD